MSVYRNLLPTCLYLETHYRHIDKNRSSYRHSKIYSYNACHHLLKNRGDLLLDFGNRSMFKQGGSWLVSLPIQWVRSMNPTIVKIEIDNKQRIIITSVSEESCRARGTEGNTNHLKEGAANE